MTQQIQDVMTKDIHTVRRDTMLREAVKLMRDRQIGDVLVTDQDGSLCGIVTDRDIVVRADAEGCDLDATPVDDICTHELTQVSPDAPVDDAIKLMRDHAIRRLPVVQGGKPVGIVSIGDLAQNRDPRSALADISAAPPNN